MLIDILAAAGGDAAPQTKFGFLEAMEQGGVIAWSILAVLVIMSIGSFYILITKMLEQNRILRQYRAIRRMCLSLMSCTAQRLSFGTLDV